MPDDPENRRTEWGPWALVAGVGVVGVVALARELRDRRRNDGASAEATDDTETDGVR